MRSIPGNDDAIRSIGLLTRVIADAAVAGLAARSAAAVAVADKVAPAEDQFTEVESALAASDAVATDALATESPAVETPAVETPAVETPAVETPATDEVKGE
jgi:small subunit ribosomal protein S2